MENLNELNKAYSNEFNKSSFILSTNDFSMNSITTNFASERQTLNRFKQHFPISCFTNNGSSNTNKYGNKLANNKLSNSIHTTPHSSSSLSPSSSSSSSFCFPSTNESSLKYGRPNGDAIKKQEKNQYLGQKNCKQLKSELYIEKKDKPVVQHLNQSSSITSLSSSYSSSTSDSSISLPKPSESVVKLRSKPINCKINIKPICYSDFQHTDKRVPNNPSRKSLIFNLSSSSSPDPTSESFTSSSSDFQRSTSKPLTTIRNSMFVNGNNMNNNMNRVLLETVSERFSGEMNKRNNNNKNNAVQLETKSTTLVDNDDLNLFKNDQSTQFLSENKKKSIVRSNSCLNSSVKTFDVSNRKELLNQRRQRHLTTTALLCNQASNHTNCTKNSLNSQVSFEDFLQSLEDINTLLENNNYLERKKIPDTFKPKQIEPLIDQRQQNKRTKRHLTQPIVFTNELSHLCSTEKAPDKIEVKSIQIKYEPRLNEASNKNFNVYKMSNENGKNVPAKKSSVVPKKFVSLSDILNNSNNTSNKSFYVPSPLTTVKENIVSNPIRFEEIPEPFPVRPAKPTQSIAYSNSFNDLLTVQALFKELELDCDEQIKILDDKERSQKEISHKQKEILDEIKQKWLFRTSNDVPSKLNEISGSSSKLKCNCNSKKSKLESRNSKNKLRFFSRTNLSKHNKKGAFQLVFLLFQDEEPIINKSGNNNRAIRTQRVIFKLKTNFNARYKTHIKITNTKSVFLFKKQHKKSNNKTKIYFTSLKNNRNFLPDIETFQLKTYRQILREQCSKNNKKSNQTKSGSNRHLMQQQSLLDKYYEKYCNSNAADMSTIKKPYCLLNQLNLSNTSNENYPFPTAASESSSAYMLSDKEKDTHDKRRALFISETNEMKNIEFANLIEACKWLIEAGYGKFVYSFLKANNNNSNKIHSNEENRLHILSNTSLNMPIRQEDTDNLNQPQLDSAIEMVRSSQYDLQDCDLNAIYRRLETLFNSASVLNLDYNYLKENYLNNIEDDEFDDEDYDDDEINYDDQRCNIDPVEDLVGLRKTRKHLPLPPLFLDEEENSSSSANLSSEEPSPTSESNRHTNMTPVQLNRNTMSNNKFVCIDFPLNTNTNSIKNKNRQSLIESASSQHNELHSRNEASSSLNRFHSFRLNEKLPNIEESNLIINSNLSKSYLDLSKSTENNSANIKTIDPILNMFPSPVQVDSNKSNSIDEKSEINLKHNLAKPTRTATVVISLRQRKDINTVKTKKNTKTDKLFISNDEIDDKVEENLIRANKDIKKSSLCNKLPIVELSRMNFCENVLTSSSESSDLSAQSYTNLTTKLIDCANDPGSTSTISSSTSYGKKSTYNNLISNASMRTSSEKKIAALAANPNLFTASSSVSGIFNNNLNTKIKSLESSIQVLSQAKQFVKSQPKTSLNDINNNVVKMKNENVNKEILKRVDANYLNLDALSTIDITLNKKQAASTIFLLNNSDENIILETTAIAAGTRTANKSITEESNQNNSKRERCDSGVGGSLTRDISKKRNKEKWASFIKSHRPSFKSSSQLQINSLSVKQYCKLKKFALVRITALMEKYSQVCQKSGWTRFKTVPKFIKRHQKSMDNTLYKNKNVFGVPLKLNFQRHGQPLPQPIIQAMKYLRRNASNTVGIFRKSGSKIRMTMLREIIERFSSESFADFEKQINNVYGNNLNNNNGDLNSIGSGFSSQSTSKSDLIDEVNTTDKSMIGSDTIAIDMADILKQYFRELPECLFTNKMSQTLIDIFTYMPEEERLEALQYCMLLLDDENRDVLQCLLYFLHDIAQNHQIHKMDARNIAICLAPTLLNMSNLKETPSANSYISPSGSPTGPPPSMYKDPTQIMTRQCNASLECLTFMIEMPKKIFQIPNEAYTKCQFTKTDYSVSLTLNELLGSYSQSMLNMYLNDRIDEMIKEIKDKPRNWNRFPNDSNIETYFKLIEDEHFPLRLWKLTIELDASPTDVLNKLLRHRAEWDDDMGESRIVETLSSQADIFQYSMNMMAPQPSRDFCELRSWCDMSHVNIKYQFVIYSASIEHDNALKLGDIRANTVKNFYLIETTSNEKKCKLHQIYRADYRGYSSEWYHKTQAYLLKRNLNNLKDCLKYK